MYHPLDEGFTAWLQGENIVDVGANANWPNSTKASGGNSFDFNVPIGSASTTLGSINEKPAMDFHDNGSIKCATTNHDTNINNYAYFFVTQINTIGYAHFVAGGEGGAQRTSVWMQSPYSTAHVFNAYTAGVNQEHPHKVEAGKTYACVAVFGATATEMHINGTLAAVGPADNTVRRSFSRLGVRDVSNTAWLDGKLGCVGLYDDYPSQAMIDRFFSWSNQYYGSDLPITHPTDISHDIYLGPDTMDFENTRWNSHANSLNPDSYYEASIGDGSGVTESSLPNGIPAFYMDGGANSGMSIDSAISAPSGNYMWYDIGDTESINGSGALVLSGNPSSVYHYYYGGNDYEAAQGTWHRLSSGIETLNPHGWFTLFKNSGESRSYIPARADLLADFGTAKAYLENIGHWTGTNPTRRADRKFSAVGAVSTAGATDYNLHRLVKYFADNHGIVN